MNWIKPIHGNRWWERLSRDRSLETLGGGEFQGNAVSDPEDHTVKFAEAVFVLHCFQKKSKRGIATPKENIDLIRERLKIVERIIKELRNEKTHH